MQVYNAVNKEEKHIIIKHGQTGLFQICLYPTCLRINDKF